MIVLLLAIFFLALLLHKVIRIHRAAIGIESTLIRQKTQLDGLSGLKRDIEDVYTQTQAYLDLCRLISPQGALPSLRGWAASPDFLIEVAKHAMQHKPKTILECSSGASTVVLARCCQLNDCGHVYSLEHDPIYAAKTQLLLAEHGLKDWATVTIAPLSGSSEHPGIPWYDTTTLPVGLKSVEMLVIDGPPGASVKHARYPAFPVLMPFLMDACTVFLDDASRPDEQEIVNQWLSRYQDFQLTQLVAEKGCAKLTRAVLAS